MTNFKFHLFLVLLAGSLLALLWAMANLLQKPSELTSRLVMGLIIGFLVSSGETAPNAYGLSKKTLVLHSEYICHIGYSHRVTFIFRAGSRNRAALRPFGEQHGAHQSVLPARTHRPQADRTGGLKWV